MERSTQGSPQAPGEITRGFGARILGAMALDRRVFREVAIDPAALRQAFAVTMIGGMAQTAGTAGLLSLDSSAGVTAGDLAAGLLTAIIAWLVSGAALWLVGTRLLGGEGSFEGVLRASGFSAAPQLLFLVCPLLAANRGAPASTWAAAALAWILSQGAWFVSVQEALALGAMRAFVAFTLAGIVTLLLGLALIPVLPSSIWQGLVF